MTGWGQSGPYAHAAGHDINYIALSGTLSMIGRAGEKPTPPINLIGDFGGGGMLLAFGVVCGTLEAGRSGLGQVIDAAMVDGAALLAAMMYGLRAGGFWKERGHATSSTPVRGVQRLRNGRWAVHLVRIVDRSSWRRCSADRSGGRVDGEGPVPTRAHRSAWPAMKERMAALVKTRTRDGVVRAARGSDACFAPVLEPDEAADHAHNRQRWTFIDVEGVVQPAPAPRFSRTEPEVAPRRAGLAVTPIGRWWTGESARRMSPGCAGPKLSADLSIVCYSRFTTGQVRVR